MAINRQKVIAAAQKHIQKGALKRAIKEYRRILEADPDDVRVLLKIGDLQARDGQLDEASTTYHEVADHYVAHGFFLKAVAVYKQLLRLQPDDVDVALHLADLYFQLSLLSDALGYLQMASKHYQQEGDLTNLIQILERMVELDPERVGNLIKLAEQYSKTGDVDRAAAMFLRAADLLYTTGRFEDYIRVAERYLYHRPQDVEQLKRVARAHLDRDEARQALARVQVLFKLVPQDMEAVDLLVEALTGIGEQQRAVTLLRELHRSYEASGAAEARDAVHAKLMALGEGPATKPVPNVDRAAKEEELERLLRECDVYIKYGLSKKAFGHVERIMALEPGSPEGARRYADLLVADDRMAEAIAWLLDLAKELGTGRAAQAVEILRIAQRLRPTDVRVARMLKEFSESEQDVSVVELGSSDYMAVDGSVPSTTDILVESGIYELQEPEPVPEHVHDVEEEFGALDGELGALFAGFEDDGAASLDDDPNLVTQMGDHSGDDFEELAEPEAPWTSAGWAAIDAEETEESASETEFGDEATSLLMELAAQAAESTPPDEAEDDSPEAILARMPAELRDDMQFVDFSIGQEDYDEAYEALDEMLEDYGPEMHIYVEAKRLIVDRLQAGGEEEASATVPPADVDARVGEISTSVSAVFSLSQKVIDEVPGSDVAEAIQQRIDGQFLEAMMTLQMEAYGPYPIPATFELALCNIAMSQYDQTADALERLMGEPELTTEDLALCHYYLGIACEAMGQRDRALDVFDVVANDPRFPDVPVRLARLRG